MAAHECDEHCRGCVQCYRETGDTVCDVICKHRLKRFLVFGYYDYYPGGGWHDFIKGFDTQEEADAFVKRFDGVPSYMDKDGPVYDNYHIIDLQDPKNYDGKWAYRD